MGSDRFAQERSPDDSGLRAVVPTYPRHPQVLAQQASTDTEADGRRTRTAVLKVTGRLADGTILWITGPKTIAEHTVPTITAAAAEAERQSPEIAATFPICVTDGSDGALTEARERAAREFASYGTLPSYRAMLDREGYEGPADLAIIGDASSVKARIGGRAECGRHAELTQSIMEFPGGSPGLLPRQPSTCSTSTLNFNKRSSHEPATH